MEYYEKEFGQMEAIESDILQTAKYLISNPQLKDFDKL